MEQTRVQGRSLRYFDYNLLFLIIFLLGFGLVMLYSVSAYEAQSEFGSATYYLSHQVRNIIIGLIIMVVMTLIPYKVWGRLAVCRTVYAAAFLLCVLVVIRGTAANGSTRWLSIGGIQFQPSEAAKIAVIIYLAALLSRMPKQIKEFRTVLKVLIRVAPLIVVIALSNLSTAIIVAGICVLMMFVASPKYSHFIILLILVAVVVVLFTMLSSYRGDRVQAWLHPEEYPDQAYQTLQGLYAIGSGGLFGKGLGGSIQKLGYVPEAQNDFIFSIICEELGLFGGICVILLFVLMIWRFMVISNNASDLLGGLLVVGVMSHIALQVILNLAVVTNSIPNTGVILPFFSYGGSSMIFLLAEMGLVLSVSRGIHVEEADLPVE
ncbi:MAG: FtsW/RodA/SpoVE family cell cycle protein [Lachnospiraceae bacterium]|nr:FtsW/RodA/SpoVE family cell cycle protein [Lachnospiraceae bacterium]